ncbi:glutathione S-transferase theta-3-like isoform X1 [Eschrichtius robustus]|uniref:glutathione S-transferase theta-3-like isoform X1 n=1 Tax=Eschrichtius robustus TaxID=9764 RepID=UPI0035BFB460
MRGWSWPGLGWITAAVNHPPPKSKLRCYLTQVPRWGWTQEGGTSGRLSVCDPLTSRVASSSLMPHLDGGLRKLVPGHWGRGWAETSEGSEFSPPAFLVSPTGQHYSDDFAQVNPLRKVPALKDGDFTLAESVAILLYLTRKYEAPDHWYPQDLQARARVDEYLAWQHTALRTSCTRTMWQKMLFPVLLGQRVPPETLASTLAELDRCLQLLEDKFLKDQDFLSGPHISVADLVAITELMHPVSAGCDIFKSRPKLAAWRQRVEAAVGEDLFQEAHAVIMKAKDLPPADTAMKERLKPLAQLLLQ